MNPTATPSRPPTPESTTVSIRNCWVMSPRLAPRARRMPISRVRSVTVASMMFMMPMPPTRSEIAAIVPRMIANWRACFCACEQQVVGDGHLDVFLGVVRLVRRLDQGHGREHVVHRADLDRDLGELGLLGLPRARAVVDDPLAEPELAGVERDIHVFVEVLGRQAAADPGRAGSRSPVTPTTV